MQILIYSKDNCTWCVKAKDLMDTLGLKYDEMVLGIDYTKEELRNLIPQDKALTVPQIFVNMQYIGGYEDFADYCQNTGIMGLQS